MTTMVILTDQFSSFRLVFSECISVGTIRTVPLTNILPVCLSKEEAFSHSIEEYYQLLILLNVQVIGVIIKLQITHS